MKNHLRQLWIVLVASLWFALGFASSLAKTSQPSTLFVSPLGIQSLPATPFFRFPVVPDAPISGSLDHNTASSMVTLYNGRGNTNTAYGYIFNCAEKQMSDFVGCEGPYSGEAACPNNLEVWYDGHKGTDFEYAANWHEPGDTCNLSRFAGITRPVYAAAAGKVHKIMKNDLYNGNAIFIKHDLDGDGNYDDDLLRSAYLHFASLDPSLRDDIPTYVTAGQYLGLGGMTGKASTPHLHFEVQRSTDSEFLTNKWSVDPFGWTGSGNDPWPYANYPLWRYYTYIPSVLKNYPPCTQSIQNGGFEADFAPWWVKSSGVTRSLGRPHSGSYSAWLGGYNNAYDTLYQVLTIPSTGPTGRPVVSARLAYYWHMTTDEAHHAFDYFYVKLRPVYGTEQTLEILSDGSTANTWVLSSQDVSAYKGQTVQVYFMADLDESYPTSFFIDDVLLYACEGP